MRKIQIGVIGSCKDLKYSDSAVSFARKLGQEIANKQYTLVYGAEKDIDSLPTIAARSANENGGITVGITYEKGLSLFDSNAASVVVASGMVRGGGRETALMLSCDAVVAISGGSGTLNEICVAYQANIPVILVEGFGGWSDRLIESYLDDRKRYVFQSVKKPKDVIDRIEELLID